VGALNISAWCNQSDSVRSRVWVGGRAPCRNQFTNMQEINLSTEEYTEAMMDRIDSVLESRFKALHETKREKRRVAKAYNRRVKKKTFQIGELVWKTILPIRNQSGKFGKWSPSWEGPLRVTGMVPGNSYFIEPLERYKMPKALNGKYLNKYYPTMWQEA
jgi:hypothetical protein